MTTALYRRYRPDTFAQVIGQDHVTMPLRAALRANKVTHAYLFSGPRGCGKTTSARIMARCLNCAEGPTDTPCGTCDSCRELATGGPGSLDVVEIDAASHGGVDDARDLRERATFAPVRDRYKVFIIDEAHMVSSAGFNALLKLVEEPPEHVKFVFATTEPDKVIGTIRSRTHHYPFRLVPPDTLGPYLTQLCGEENISIDSGVIPLVMRAGGGSVRDTLSVLDQLMAGAVDGAVSYATAVALLGYTDAALLDQSVDALAGGDGAAAYRVIEKMVESGHDPRRFVEDLLQRLRDLLIISVAGDGAAEVLVGTPADQLERMFVQARNWGPGHLSRVADLTDQALRSMTGATSPRLQLELLLGRILVPVAGVSDGAPDTVPGMVGMAHGGAPRADAPPSGERSFGARQAREALARAREEKSAGQVTSPIHEGGAAGQPGAPSHARPAPTEGPQAGIPDGAGAPPSRGGDVGTRPVGSDGALSHAGDTAPAATDTAPASTKAGDPSAGASPSTHSAGWATAQPGSGPASVSPAQKTADQTPSEQHRPEQSSALSSRVESTPPAHSGQADRHPGAEQRPVSHSPRDMRPGLVNESPQPSRPPQETPATQAPAAAQGHVGRDADLLRGRWGEVVERLSTLSRVVWQMVEHNGQLGAVDASTAIIVLPTAGHVANFNNSGKAAVVEQAIHETTGLRLSVRAELGQSSGGPTVTTPGAPAGGPSGGEPPRSGGPSGEYPAGPAQGRPGGNSGGQGPHTPQGSAPQNQAGSTSWGEVAEPGSGRGRGAVDDAPSSREVPSEHPPSYEPHEAPANFRTEPTPTPEIDGASSGQVSWNTDTPVQDSPQRDPLPTEDTGEYQCDAPADEVHEREIRPAHGGNFGDGDVPPVEEPPYDLEEPPYDPHIDDAPSDDVDIPTESGPRVAAVESPRESATSDPVEDTTSSITSSTDQTKESGEYSAEASTESSPGDASFRDYLPGDPQASWTPVAVKGHPDTEPDTSPARPEEAPGEIDESVAPSAPESAPSPRDDLPEVADIDGDIPPADYPPVPEEVDASAWEMDTPEDYSPDSIKEADSGLSEVAPAAESESGLEPAPASEPAPAPREPAPEPTPAPALAEPEPAPTTSWAAAIPGGGTSFDPDPFAEPWSPAASRSAHPSSGADTSGVNSPSAASTEEPRPTSRLAALRASSQQTPPATEPDHVRAADDDSASLDDDDVDTSTVVGVAAVLDILGGTIIDTLPDHQAGR
ncbi:MAG: DNA polymerase III subunit gamma and tau [Actinomycetaceae bacterium]|nr:DNA polymerase III subunit gamma and tau [Actinomycetaceae bacterium]